MRLPRQLGNDGIEPLLRDGTYDIQMQRMVAMRFTFVGLLPFRDVITVSRGVGSSGHLRGQTDAFQFSTLTPVCWKWVTLFVTTTASYFSACAAIQTSASS